MPESPLKLIHWFAAVRVAAINQQMECSGDWLQIEECKLPDQMRKAKAENKKPAGFESAAGFSLIWCPGEDSNLHSVATART